MSSNRRFFAEKLPAINTDRDPYFDVASNNINIEMSLYLDSIETSAQQPLPIIQYFIKMDESADKTELVDTIILELYGL